MSIYLMKEKIKQFVETSRETGGILGKTLGLSWDKLRQVRSALFTGPYRGQFGQDKVVDNYFGENPGFYVEVGAHDGKSYSNTHFLQFRRGWHGLCVEPNRALFEKLARTRLDGTCYCFPCALDSSSGEAAFIEADWWGTLEKRLTSKHNEEFLEGTKQERTIVEMKTLQELLNVAGVLHVNYLSLDTEGNELQVLQGVDWEKVSFDIMSVENNWEEKGVRDYLGKRGYTLLTRLGVDDIFIRGR